MGINFLQSIFICFLLLPSLVHATTYLSQDDKDLFIKRFFFETPKDNVGGIYSRPLGEHLQTLVANDLQWDLVVRSDLAEKTSDYEDNPKGVLEALKKFDCGGLVELRLSKGPNGINMRLNLYTKQDGKLLVQESLNNFKGFELSEVKNQLTILYKSLRYHLPFRGFVMSRQGQQITFNMGENFELRNGSEIDVFQIIKIQRHPKLGFMVDSEKMLLGKAKIFKVDRAMSFAFLTFEKEPGAIQVGAKVWPEGLVQYQEPLTDKSGDRLSKNLESPSDRKIFGEKPNEWVPVSDPQYGRLSVFASAGQYNQTGNTETGGAYNATNSLIPAIKLNAEMWLNKEWTLAFQTRQSAFSLSNPLSDSTPDKLIMSMSQFDLLGAYNLLLTDEFFGPKFQISFGLNNTNFDVDNGSPIALTKMSYGGAFTGLAGSFYTGEHSDIELGAQLRYFWTKTLSENPISGTDVSSNISMFGVYLGIQSTKRIRWVGDLEFQYFSSGFSGSGVRTASSVTHNLQFLSLGMEYSF